MCLKILYKQLKETYGYFCTYLVLVFTVLKIKMNGLITNLFLKQLVYLQTLTNNQFSNFMGGWHGEF